MAKGTYLARARLSHLVYVPLAQLENAQIVEALRMRPVNTHRHLARLVSKTEVANAHCHVRNVVPYVRRFLILSKRERALEARQRHVVLPCVEATHTEVVPQLGADHAHLKQPSVVPEGRLWLVGVECVVSEAREGLDT